MTFDKLIYNTLIKYFYQTVWHYNVHVIDAIPENTIQSIE